jgi:hypothetical protein
VDRLGGEGCFVLPVRGLGYIGDDDADDGAALLAGPDVVTDRVGVIEELGPSAALTRTTFSLSAVAVLAEEALGERRDAQRGEVARDDPGRPRALLGTELATI